MPGPGDLTYVKLARKSARYSSTEFWQVGITAAVAPKSLLSKTMERED